MEKYQRASAKELDSILLRIGMIKEQPELFQDIYDSDGEIVPVENLSKANELTGAGVEYLTSVAEYIYTHFKKNIDRSNSKYDELPVLEWGAFLKIASGGITGQIDRIERTVMQYVAKPKMVFMIDMDDRLHTRWPFVLDFEWEGLGNLDAKQAARFARLNKPTKKIGGKNKPIRINEITGEIIPLLPIKKITIMAAKPLFEQFFKRDASTYSFPTGMYAKLFDIANTFKKTSLKNQPKDPGLLCFDSDLYISSYTRVMRFIMRHNNLTPSQMKNKKTVSPIRIDVIEFFMSVYPSAISKNGRGERHIEYSKAGQFLTNASFMFFKIPDFKIYPLILLTKGMKKLEIWLYTDKNAALEAWEAIAKLSFL